MREEVLERVVVGVVQRNLRLMRVIVDGGFGADVVTIDAHGDLHIDAAWVGVYFGLTAAAALVAQLGCGSFIVRYGALRVSQISLVMLAGGTALAALGTPLAFIVAAIACGAGGAISTPASSHLLGRVSSPMSRRSRRSPTQAGASGAARAASAGRFTAGIRLRTTLTAMSRSRHVEGMSETAGVEGK